MPNQHTVIRDDLSARRRRRQLNELLRRQDGVARRDQLAAAGVTSDDVAAQLRARRWQTLGPIVVVTHNGPLTAAQLQWIGVLHCGPRAALAARSAATAGGLTGWELDVIEIVVPRGTTVPDLPGIPLLVHESRRLRHSGLHPIARPSRTRIERSLVDAAAWSSTDRAACDILCAGVQQRLTTAPRLLLALSEAGRIRRRSLLTATTHDIDGGAQALSEIDFHVLCRRWRLPAQVVRQEVRRDRFGKRRYLDVVLIGPDGRSTRIEIDGALHLLVLSYWDDMARQNELTIAGRPVLRFPSVAVRIDEERVMDQVVRALGLPAPLVRLSTSARSSTA